MYKSQNTISKVIYIRHLSFYICPVCPLAGISLFHIFTMSAPSTTASQTDFCGAISRAMINIMRIQEETCQMSSI